MKVVIGIGVPGSGKSTFLKPYAKQNGMVYINADEIREELTGDPRDHSRHFEVWDLAHDRIVKALRNSSSVVVDGTYTRKRDRLQLNQLCLKAGATEIIGHIFNPSLEISLARNAARERIVPPEAVTKMHNRLLLNPPVKGEGFTKIIRHDDSKSNPNIRLYFQMKPDDKTLKSLVNVIDRLPPQLRGRQVQPPGLHLTLIHFGKIQDVFDVIRQKAEITYEEYARLLEVYINDSQAHMPTESIDLQPVRLAQFGERGGTLVVEYEATPELLDHHGKLYKILYEFLAKCGVKDVESFIAADRNFMHAPKLRPHITLYKGFLGDLPKTDLPVAQLSSMPVVYPPVI